MAKDSELRPTLSPSGRQAAAERQARQAAALRENLRKRKAQQRARSDADTADEARALDRGREDKP
ncbi:MAG: hypothetical protein ACREE7_10310 [Dongiaceae bacterium]